MTEHLPSSVREALSNSPNPSAEAEAVDLLVEDEAEHLAMLREVVDDVSADELRTERFLYHMNGGDLSEDEQGRDFLGVIAEERRKIEARRARERRVSNWYEGLRVVGTSYRREQVERILRPDWIRAVTVTLVPEPSNPHDAQAISVEHDGTLIGYIARDKTHIVREWIGDDPTARVEVPATVYRVHYADAPAVALGPVPAASEAQRDYATRLLSGLQTDPITEGQAELIAKANVVEAARLIDNLLARQRASN